MITNNSINDYCFLEFLNHIYTGSFCPSIFIVLCFGTQTFPSDIMSVWSSEPIPKPQCPDIQQSLSSHLSFKDNELHFYISQFSRLLQPLCQSDTFFFSVYMFDISTLGIINSISLIFTKWCRVWTDEHICTCSNTFPMAKF